ncbi:hypothetical protein [Leptolyngbya sp. FACHB-261]|uniref:hypothetical protein n=1 Tax=Leptolyngbya sp. FACHB-261 TaxID=2692806 RepID=UPI00168994AD|nr:hypothetical protein [Leptolyngbya sp. FACHB-261]
MEHLEQFRQMARSMRFVPPQWKLPDACKSLTQVPALPAVPSAGNWTDWSQVPESELPPHVLGALHQARVQPQTDHDLPVERFAVVKISGSQPSDPFQVPTIEVPPHERFAVVKIAGLPPLGPVANEVTSQQPKLETSTSHAPHAASSPTVAEVAEPVATLEALTTVAVAPLEPGIAIEPKIEPTVPIKPAIEPVVPTSHASHAAAAAAEEVAVEAPTKAEELAPLEPAALPKPALEPTAPVADHPVEAHVDRPSPVPAPPDHEASHEASHEVAPEPPVALVPDQPTPAANTNAADANNAKRPAKTKNRSSQAKGFKKR